MNPTKLLVSGMGEQVVHIEGIGEVRIQRMRRKTISIQLKPFKTPVVKLPWYCTYKQGIEFATLKRKWIQNKLKEHAVIESNTMSFEFDRPYQIRSQTLIIQQGHVQIPTRKRRGDKTYITMGAQHLASDQGQTYCKETYEEILRFEAKDYLPGRLALLADRFRLIYNKVTIRNTRSRWGSCSHQNNISLSLHLMRLPDHLIDYVLLHELAHTKEKNHGPGFWQLLDTLTDGKARALDREVKQHQLRHY